MRTAKMLDRIRLLCDEQDVLPTIEAMMGIFGADRSSITGRIADLRSEGYDIKLQHGRYVVHARPPKAVEPLPISLEMQLKNSEADNAGLRARLTELRQAVEQLYWMATATKPD